MNISDFINKEYQIPKNIPNKTKHKYLEVIEKGYAKYLEIVYYCGKFILYKQFYELVKMIEGSNRTDSSNQVIANKIINRLIDLGFIGSDNINKNKYFYLKKPSYALVLGDYKNNKRVILSKDLKNNKFKTILLTNEYFIKNKTIVHSYNMFNQLKIITQVILNQIIDTDNRFGYNIDSIEKILDMNDFKSIINYLKEHPEINYKLDIIRYLWLYLGDLYSKMSLQRQTIDERPEFFKLFIKSDGQLIIHYAPKIIIFDIEHDMRFYKDKLIKLFHLFNKIPNNELREVQKTYLNSRRKKLGFEGHHHIGYRLKLIGDNLEALKAKKILIDKEIYSSINSPMIDYCEIEYLDIAKYLLHSSRRNNKYIDKHDKRIDEIIINKLNDLRRSEK